MEELIWWIGWTLLIIFTIIDWFRPMKKDRNQSKYTKRVKQYGNKECK